MRTPSTSCSSRGMRHTSRVGVRAAFTIVEMLVVIGIIAVLVGLVMPAVSSARRAATVSQDLSNLRSLSQAHAAYMNVFKDRFVDAALPHGGMADPNADTFVDTLQPYVGSELALRSPLDRSTRWPPQDVTSVPPGSVFRRTSYGMNNYLSRRYSPEVALSGAGSGADALSRVPDPSSTVCFLLMAEEGDFATADHPHVEDWASLSQPGQVAAVAARQVAINAVDRLKPSPASESDWSFVDGHVATARFETLYESVDRNKFDPRAK